MTRVRLSPYPGMGATMELKEEMETYKAHQNELVLANEGRFVLIKGGAIRGPYDSYDAALDAGYEAFGPVPFLVKRIVKGEPIHHISRPIPR